MGKKSLSLVYLMVLFLLVQCEDSKPKPEVKQVTVSAKEAKMQLKSELPSDELLAIYIEIKNAMVNDDSTLTSAKLKELQALVAKKKTEEDKEANLALLTKMEVLATTMESLPFEEQRFSFIELTERFLKWQELHPNSEKLYLQYCPMYKGGNYWLSMEEAVYNPYYGSKMLRCGVVEKVFN